MICICLSCTLSADSVEEVERKILTMHFDIYHLIPAYFAMDLLYSVPSIMSTNIVQDDRLDPGEESSRTVGRCGSAQKEGAEIQGTWR